MAMCMLPLAGLLHVANPNPSPSTWLANVMTRLVSSLGTGKRCLRMLDTRLPRREEKLSRIK